MSELLKDAIEDFNNLLQLLNKIGQNRRRDIEKSFRARTRQIPSLIYEVGLIPTLSFLYSKSSKTIYDKIKKIFENPNDSSNLNEILNNPPEKVGYALYLYFILKELTKLLNIQTTDPYEVIKKLSQDKNLCIIATNIIMPYLVQIKRLSEAIFTT